MADKKVDGKESVRLATNTNSIGDLSKAPLIIDSVSIAEGDRILVKNKASIDGVEPVSDIRNGIYVVRKITGGSASLLRAKDANTDREVNSAMYMFIEEGASNKDSGWLLTTDDPIKLDVTPLIFEKFTNAGQISDSIQKTINANSDNIALLAFRNQTQDSLTIQKMVDGIVDEYEVETNIDAGLSIDKIYNAGGSFFTTENTLAKLLLHYNGADGSTTIIDSSSTGYNVTPSGNAKLDTSAPKFGTADLSLDGAGDFLTVPDDPDWDVFASLTEDYSIDCWVKIPTLAQGMTIVSQFEDSNNHWYCLIPSNGNIQFVMQKANVNEVLAIGTGAFSASASYQHLAFIKVQNEVGIYIDGVQVAHDTVPTTRVMSAVLKVGRLDLGSDFKGNMDELRMQKSNIFSASPNSGLTDTITVPTSEAPLTTVNTTLVSEASTATSQADTGRIVLFLEELETIAIGTDLKASISRDDGTTFSEVILVNKGEYQDGKNILSGSVDISSQPAGTDMRYKIETFNNKRLNLHGSALSWK